MPHRKLAVDIIRCNILVPKQQKIVNPNTCPSKRELTSASRTSSAVKSADSNSTRSGSAEPSKRTQEGSEKPSSSATAATVATSVASPTASASSKQAQGASVSVGSSLAQSGSALPSKRTQECSKKPSSSATAATAATSAALSTASASSKQAEGVSIPEVKARGRDTKMIVDGKKSQTGQQKKTTKEEPVFMGDNNKEIAEATDPTVNNLGTNIASEISKSIPEFLNILEGQEGYRSDSSSDDNNNACSNNLAATHAKEDNVYKKLETTSVDEGRAVSQRLNSASMPDNLKSNAVFLEGDDKSDRSNCVKEEGSTRFGKDRDSSQQRIVKEAPRAQCKNGPTPHAGGTVATSSPAELARNLFQCLCTEYDCSAPLHVLQERKDLFLQEQKGSKDWLRENKDKFLINENADGSIQDVSAFCPKLRLCFDYVFLNECTRTKCMHFHLCRKFVTGSCNRGKSCPRGHQFRNKRDQEALSKLKIDWLTNEQLRILMLSSAPQVCTDYNKGICEQGFNCSRVHICKNFLTKTCEEGSKCRLIHEAALDTYHTKTLFESYRLEKMRKNDMMKVILVCEKPRASQSVCSEKSKQPSLTDAGLSPGDSKQKVQEKSLTENVRKRSTGPTSSKPVSPQSEDLKRERKSLASNSCKPTGDSSVRPPSEKTVFKCICKEYDGSVSFAVISTRNDIFPEGYEKISAWFRARQETFLISENNNGAIMQVSALCRRARLCFDHTSTRKCSNEACQYLHACKEYIAGSCRFGDRCKMNHDFGEDHKVISKLGLDGLSTAQLCKVVKLSSPQVCLDHNSGNCEKGGKCSKIHICKNFLKIKCDEEDNCTLGHRTALKTAHTRGVLHKYGINGDDDNLYAVQRMVLVCDHDNDSGHSKIYGGDRRTRRESIPEMEASKTVQEHFGSQTPAEKKQRIDDTKSYKCARRDSLPELEAFETRQERSGSRTSFVENQPSVDAKGYSSDNSTSSETLPELEAFETVQERFNSRTPPELEANVQVVQEWLRSNTSSAKNQDSDDARRGLSIPVHKRSDPGINQCYSNAESIGHVLSPSPVVKTCLKANLEPSECKVFEIICKEYGCSVAFSVIAQRVDLFAPEFPDVESWFRKKSASFFITETDKGEILRIDAFSTRAQLCVKYTSRGSCQKKNCPYLHLCRDFVTDTCIYGATCTQNHDFLNERDRPFLSDANVGELTEGQLRELVLSSNPHVCLDYNNGCCELGVSCTRIHICKDFVKKCCEDGNDCDLGHESAMDTDHTLTILERYLLNTGESSERLVKMILVSKESPLSGKSNETGHIHSDKPDAPICLDFLAGKCKKWRRCSRHHCSRPFHWQFKLSRNESWKSFSENGNDTLEKLYCDVNQEFCQISTISGVVKVNLDVKRVTTRDSVVEIRRLTTVSHMTNPSHPLATSWKWYWKKESGVWREHGVNYDCRDLQWLLEEAFLNERSTFEFSHVSLSSKCELCFLPSSTGFMYQKDLIHGTSSPVRRRPARFVSREDILQLKRVRDSSTTKQLQNSKSVPSHWSSMPPNVQWIRVELTPSSTEFKEVELLFKKMMSDNVVTSSIERVQNPFMWEKYCRKKELMGAGKTHDQKKQAVNEMQLFHGTSSEVVDAICKQNFDWRLHGKNATAYGEGSYFALNASYSRKFTGENADSCHFMFLANVLVGSYTKGHRSFRRPPPRDPSNPTSDLYDSCVDDELRPAVFVVFDTDQVYPAYVIKYSDESSTAARQSHNPQQMTQAQMLARYQQSYGFTSSSDASQSQSAANPISSGAAVNSIGNGGANLSSRVGGPALPKSSTTPMAQSKQRGSVPSSLPWQQGTSMLSGSQRTAPPAQSLQGTTSTATPLHSTPKVLPPRQHTTSVTQQRHGTTPTATPRQHVKSSTSLCQERPASMTQERVAAEARPRQSTVSTSMPSHSATPVPPVKQHAAAAMTQSQTVQLHRRLGDQFTPLPLPTATPMIQYSTAAIQSISYAATPSHRTAPVAPVRQRPTTMTQPRQNMTSWDISASVSTPRPRESSTMTVSGQVTITTRVTKPRDVSHESSQGDCESCGPIASRSMPRLAGHAARFHGSRPSDSAFEYSSLSTSTGAKQSKKKCLIM